MVFIHSPATEWEKALSTNHEVSTWYGLRTSTRMESDS